MDRRGSPVEKVVGRGHFGQGPVPHSSSPACPPACLQPVLQPASDLSLSIRPERSPSPFRLEERTHQMCESKRYRRREAFGSPDAFGAPCISFDSTDLASSKTPIATSHLLFKKASSGPSFCTDPKRRVRHGKWQDHGTGVSLVVSLVVSLGVSLGVSPKVSPRVSPSETARSRIAGGNEDTRGLP